MEVKIIHKILIIHTWGLGDLIMFTPCLKVLRENFPQAQIDMFTVSAKGVFDENSIVNTIFEFEWKKRRLFDKLTFIYKLRKEKYDLAIVTTSINTFKGGLFCFLIGAKMRVGEYRKTKSPFYTNQVKLDGDKHKIETNLHLLKALGIKIDANTKRQQFFQFGDIDREFAKDFIRQNGLEDKVLIGFFPASSPEQQFKRWGAENFIKLGELILAKVPNSFILLFGDNQESINAQIMEGLGSKGAYIAGYQLKKVAALMDKCKIFIAGDTGLGHIAATTNTNLIVILGPTIFERSGPIGDRVFIIKEKCRYPYHDVFTRRYDTTRDHQCLKKITPAMVFDKVTLIVKNSK